MERKEKTQSSFTRKLVLIILIILIILGVFFTIYAVKYTNYQKSGMEKIFDKTQEKTAKLTEYIVYGTHLNLKGIVKDNIEDVSKVNLVFGYLDGTESKIELNYNKTHDGINFYTSEIINEGIDLEKLSVNKYYFLIEVQNEKKKSKYYSIENKTEYDEISYYTITKNHSNNKISIKFSDYEIEEKQIPYMFMEVKVAKLPKDVYDVVIDPGHGGSDTGAKYGGYDEADLTLEYGNMIKTRLERLGLKVKMTRDGTENEETFGTRNCL